jgi:hypothetical protein
VQSQNENTELRSAFLDHLKPRFEPHFGPHFEPCFEPLDWCALRSSAAGGKTFLVPVHRLELQAAIFNTSVWLQAGQYLALAAQIPAKQKSGCRPLVGDISCWRHKLLAT